MRSWRASLLTLVVPMANLACSADAVREPGMTFETKGAFTALAADGGTYELVRTLATLGVGNDDDAFFILPYDASPKTFEEARELAKDPDLPTKRFTIVGRRYFESREWRAVWFRSVTSEEEAAFR